jgi:hypothetical protein
MHPLRARNRIHSEATGWQHRRKKVIGIIEQEIISSGGKILTVHRVGDIERLLAEPKLAVILSFGISKPPAVEVQNTSLATWREENKHEGWLFKPYFRGLAMVHLNRNVTGRPR